MGAVELRHTVKTPSGTPIPNVNIVARLNKPAVRTADNSQVTTIQTFKTDSEGKAKLILEKTNDMTPIDTYWIVDIQVPNKHGGPQIITVRSNTEQALMAARVAV